MRVLVCGGRDYFGPVDCLGEIHIDVLIQGGCKGADVRAAEWAKRNGIHVATVSALWDLYGLKAGPKRNEAMLFLRPEYVVAFPGGKGTADMVRRAESLGVPVWRPYG